MFIYSVYGYLATFSRRFIIANMKIAEITQSAMNMPQTPTSGMSFQKSEPIPVK